MARRLLHWFYHTEYVEIGYHMHKTYHVCGVYLWIARKPTVRSKVQ